MFKLIFAALFVVIANSANALPVFSKGQQPLNFRIELPDPDVASNYNFEGIVRLNNCSGSIVRFENSQDTDAAMVLTNGHCLDWEEFLQPGQVVVNRPEVRKFVVYDSQAKGIGTVISNTIIYATMTKTDLALYKLKQSFAEIKRKYRVRPYTLSADHPKAGTSIDIISGYWSTGYSCAIDRFIPKLQEENYTWEDAIRYTPGCDTIHGTSGSPIIMQGTRNIIGIHNTKNDDGEKCTMNNPCEIDETGNITWAKDLHYGEQIFWIYSCLDKNHKLDLNLPNCQLYH